MKFSVEGRVIASGTLERQIRQHQGEVWHYLRTLGCDREAANDLTQEAFLVILRKGFRFDDPHGAKRYPRQTAKYLFLDQCRANGRSPWDKDSEAWAEAVDAAWEQPVATDTETWLAALKRCRARLEGRRRSHCSMASVWPGQTWRRSWG